MNKPRTLLLVASVAGLCGGAIALLLMRLATPQPVVIEWMSPPQPETQPAGFSRAPNAPMHRVSTRPVTTAPPARSAPSGEPVVRPAGPRASEDWETSLPPAAMPQWVVNQSAIKRVNVAAPLRAIAIEPQAPPSARDLGKGDGAKVEDALSFALEAADPYVKEGFTVREDYWCGDLPVKTTKAIVHQLFKGNEYWFCMGAAVKDARISVDVYDSEGNLAEIEAWAQPHAAAARVVPKKTGSYYLIVEVEKSSAARTTWALAYGFR